VYLAEKGIEVPTEQVNIMAGENRTPAFLAKNPMGGLPVLELDDGTHLPESLASRSSAPAPGRSSAPSSSACWRAWARSSSTPPPSWPGG
jgi:hypothetical protein